MIEHKLLKDNSPIHVFYEDLIFSSDKLGFGFEILINWKGMKELFNILWNGGEFIAKNGRWSRKFSFDLKSKTLTQVYKELRASEETVQIDRLNEEQIKELSQLLADTYNKLHADIVLKTKEKNVKISVSMKIRNSIKTITETAPESTKDDLPSIPKPKEETLATAQINDNNDSVVSIVSETAPESPKEEKVEENKPNEESFTTAQINDNNDSIIGQSIPEVKQEEVKLKTVWDPKEVKDIVFKVEKIDENKLDEVSLSKKSDIAGYFWASHEALLAKLYGIRVPTKENGEPDKEAYKEIRKYFGKIFNVAV